MRTKGICDTESHCKLDQPHEKQEDCTDWQPWKGIQTVENMFPPVAPQASPEAPAKDVADCVVWNVFGYSLDGTVRKDKLVSEISRAIVDARARLGREGGMINPYIEQGIEQLRTKWPQTHFERNKHGYHLIVVPGVILPKGWDKTICTVLFLAPPGFPAACPDHFFTDIEIRREDKSWPQNTNIGNGAWLGQLGWPQWSESMWWSWHLQMWNPNQSSLYTYMKVIQQRLNPAR